jgi:two-component system, NarL family, sensor kinase
MITLKGITGKETRIGIAIIFAALVVTGIITWRLLYREQAANDLSMKKENGIPFRNDYIEAVNLLLSNPDSAMAIVQKIIRQSGSNELSDELVPYYNVKGIYYRNQAMYDKSIETFYACLEYAMQNNQQRYIAEAWENIGMVNFLTYRYKDALGMMMKSLDIYHELGDSLKIAWLYNSVGRVWFEIGDMERAVSYYRKAGHIFSRRDFPLGISSVSNHLAKYYLEINLPDSALIYLNNAISHAMTTKNNYGLSNIYLERGNFYLETGDHTKAIINFSISDSIANNLNFTPLNIYPKLALAGVYTSLGQLEQAHRYLLQAHSLTSLHTSDKLNYKLNEVFSMYYEKLGDSNNAFRYYKMANQHKEQMISRSETFQVYNIEIEQLSGKMEMQDIEMKRQAMLLAQRKNTLVLIVVASLLAIVLLSLLYYFYLLRLRQAEKEKMHRQQLKYSSEKNQAVLEAEINERKRLASEMHDGIGSQLSLVKLTLSNIIGRPGLAGEKKEHLLQNTMSSVDDIIREVKNISDSMTPQVLTKKGLKEALKELVAKYAQIRSYKIKLSIVGLNHAVKPVAGHTIFRTVQELMANAMKHSAGSEISVQILQTDDDLLIMIEDDGKGFDVDHPGNNKSFGLKNTRSRVESLNGQLLIDSMTKRGTIITITIPAGDVFIKTETHNN